MRRHVEKMLTPSQIKNSQDLAREWKLKHL